MTEENLAYDIIIIGAGPAGLASAIHLKQLAVKNNINLSVCVLEKGAAVGAHIISGAVFEADALSELIPDWSLKNAPIRPESKVIEDKFYFLTKNNKYTLPVPKTFKNTNSNNYIISLGSLCKWLAQIAEQLGVEIFPGFAAKELLIKDNKVYGVCTTDFGIAKDGSKTANYQPGVAIHGTQIILAEGCRGSVTKEIIKRFNLSQKSQTQSYGLGIKEIWQLDKNNPHYRQGLVEHSVGWPLDNDTYGGSFIYHLPNHQIAYGFVVGLDYKNPYLSPFEEAQRFKTHPKIKPLFINATRISYGARALCEGGFQSIPTLSFPGGLIVGDAAGFLNVAKIKGTHNAIRSGMIAAKTIINNILSNQLKSNSLDLNHNYQENIFNSAIIKELYKIRNIRPSFKLGLVPGFIYSAIDSYILQGNAPWTFKHHQDNKMLIKNSKPINYPKPDNKITFDRTSSVYLSNTHHNDNQPIHLKLINPSLAVSVNYKEYGGPEQYYCPAGVYEYLKNDKNEMYLQINAQNCVHCKTCDIKDPQQNINWVPPEGGGGPNYVDM